jgi:hypothetical protein
MSPRIGKAEQAGSVGIRILYRTLLCLILQSCETGALGGSL